MTDIKTVTITFKDGSSREHQIHDDRGPFLPFYSGDIEVYEDQLTGDVIIKEYQASRGNIGCDWKVDKDKSVRYQGSQVEKIIIKEGLTSNEREVIPQGILKRID